MSEKDTPAYPQIKRIVLKKVFLNSFLDTDYTGFADFHGKNL